MLDERFDTTVQRVNRTCLRGSDHRVSRTVSQAGSSSQNCLQSFPTELGDPEGEEPEGEEVSLALVAYLTRITALTTRLDKMDHRLNRIEKGIARIEQRGGDALPAQQAED